MNNTVNIIFNDINLEEPVEAEILPSPYIENMTDTTKINTLHRFLLRAIKKRQRKQVLTYAYYLGQLIESDPVMAKRARRTVSEHYFVTSVRVYYIFEMSPQQIARTQVTTLNMIRRLRAEDYVSLTSII